MVSGLDYLKFDAKDKDSSKKLLFLVAESDHNQAFMWELYPLLAGATESWQPYTHFIKLGYEMNLYFINAPNDMHHILSSYEKHSIDGIFIFGHGSPDGIILSHNDAPNYRDFDTFSEYKKSLLS